MSDKILPRLMNDAGVGEIRVGAREIECIGAAPPHDHPHIYLDMGAESSIVCSYCGTRFVYSNELDPAQCDPPSSLYELATL